MKQKGGALGVSVSVCEKEQKRGNKMCRLLETINFHRVFVFNQLNRLMVRCEILLWHYVALVQF
jgi:hypothetical protein